LTVLLKIDKERSSNYCLCGELPSDRISESLLLMENKRAHGVSPIYANKFSYVNKNKEKFLFPNSKPFKNRFVSQ